MNKSIVILALALVAFTNGAEAKTAIYPLTTKEIVDNYNNTPLCSAIIKGDLETVKKFIEYGSDVNQTSNGLTPLMFAARYNNVEIIKLLIEKGADKWTKDERGNTAIKYAENSKAFEAVAYLKQA